MRIGGFLPQSLIDYPGKIAAVIFTQGCNFCCGYCHNPELVLPKCFNPILDENEILHTISERAGWLDAIVVTGGEPTIHVDLPDFLNRLKNTGLLIKLDTNGSNPKMLKTILDNQLVDYVAMDIKNLFTPSAYGKVIGVENCDKLLESIKQSFEMIKASKIETEFRTTCIPGIHNPSVIKELEKITEGFRYTIQQFREGETIKMYNQQT